MPEAVPKLYLWMLVAVWPLILIAGWLLNRHWVRRYDRLGESTSEEILAELSKAYSPRHSIRIQTPTEYLPFVFESIREVVDAGFGDKQTLSLLQRIDIHRPYDERRALFPVEVKSGTADLLFEWSRDPGNRIRLRVTAAPVIIRALRRQKAKIPKARWRNEFVHRTGK